MSDKSNNQGRAYEYACINELNTEINKIRKSEIIEDSAYLTSSKAWDKTSDSIKLLLIKAAKAMTSKIFDIEPMILEKSSDILQLKIQTDGHGKQGDARDIVISRLEVEWEIGLSIKHNHFAVKHSRLSKNLDFGKKWFNISCSEKYWKDIKPIFDYLQKQEDNNLNWSDISFKDKKIYMPLLKAFMDEIKRSYHLDQNLPKKMVEYLIGKFDFYKIIGEDKKEVTYIQSYNLHGSLNKATKKTKAKINIPLVDLPTRIIDISFKPNSTNTIELYLDGGWQFSFRIHNAATKVQTSLKFDIKIIGMPTTIILINCFWK